MYCAENRFPLQNLDIWFIRGHAVCNSEVRIHRFKYMLEWWAISVVLANVESRFTARSSCCEYDVHCKPYMHMQWFAFIILCQNYLFNPINYNWIVLHRIASLSIWRLLLHFVKKLLKLVGIILQNVLFYWRSCSHVPSCAHKPHSKLFINNQWLEDRGWD